MKKEWAVIILLLLCLFMQYYFYNEALHELSSVVDIQSILINNQKLFIDELNEQLKEALQYNESNRQMKPKIRMDKVIKAIVTAYTPSYMECDSTPLIAASMERVRAGTIAVSRDLFYQGWTFGKKVYIEGNGIFQINDLMNERHENRIDIFMWKKEDAKKFGKITVRVALLEELWYDYDS